MSHFDFCRRNIGSPVKIVTRDGVTHRGYINRVNRSKVFIEPFQRRGLGGYGYGFFGYGSGLGIGIALGAIATIAVLPFFFW
ncbi:hypothetical protein SH601_04405 [Gracilibacillus sp. S3-1-1]|uniref:Uncharacterized protein n=1 Tax=Gracilibacillus pellucidus TaxID=3095368 RepID=A0ACC6M2N1_9BACI|nr:hypothetical protein [Gracilibacillus sp. S3-1-1]MDX8045223.1 hypothetical protein [Gracilibacillus sp. S3-1-1]